MPPAWLVPEETYEKTPSVGRRQPMTSLPARPQYKDGRANTSSAFSSSLTGLFEETCILVGIQFPLFIMASTSKAFEIVCGSVSSLFDTRWHTRSLRLLFGRRARTRCLWGGNLRALWESSVLVCPSFRGKRGSRLLPAIRYPPLPRHGGDWNRGVRSWIWPMS